MSKQRLFAGCSVVLVLAAIGCGDDSTVKHTDAGTDGGSTSCSQSALAGDDSGTGADSGSTDDAGGTHSVGGAAPATFKQVYEGVIIANSCDSAFCHGGTETGGLSLIDQASSYANLVGVAAQGPECACKTTKKRVEAGKPDESLLVEKLEKAKPVCGTQMPPPGGAEPAVTQNQIELVRSWISAGAKND
jgi:hypothetical protein